MSRWQSVRLLAAPVGVLALLSGISSSAAEPSWNWSGFYFGGHVGALTGTTTFSDPAGPSLFGDQVTTPGFAAGVQLGYNWLLAPQWVAGAEATGSILSSQGQNTCFQSSISRVGSNCTSMPRQIVTLTGRLGYLTEPHGRTMVYGKAGAAWMRSDLAANPNNTGLNDFSLTGDPNEPGNPVSQSFGVWGWTVGAGIEYALSSRWSLDVGYSYLHFSGIDMAAPGTIDVTTAGRVSSVPPGAPVSITQDLHLARLGLNYRWGGASNAAAQPSPATKAAAPWTPGWEFNAGVRYWYSSGKFQSANGSPTFLVSRLPYDHLDGHSGELFARLDSPGGIFVKGFAGGGVISNGTMYDEDWGLPFPNSPVPTGYEVIQSGVTGSFSYLTADVGFNVMRGPDHKVGLFVGYNRFQYLLDTLGCMQLVNYASQVCVPTVASDHYLISELDTWHSLRIGLSAEAEIWRRVKIGADVAYLPYAYVDARDIHRGGNYFPITGTGNGVQAEMILSYAVTDSFSIGIGGRYWAMWTTDAWQVDQPSNIVRLNTERYGVLLQAAYKFYSSK